MQIAGKAMIDTIMKICCFMDNRDKVMCDKPLNKYVEFQIMSVAVVH